LDKKYFTQRLASLEISYNDFKPMWQELADYFLPRQTKFLVRGSKTLNTNKKILNSKTVLAVRNFSSGILSGAMSPARKWFKLAMHGNQPQQNMSYEVKDWLSDTAKLIRDIYNGSNLYLNLPVMFSQLGVFGISAMSVQSDFDDIIRTKILPIGSYRIAENEKGIVDTLYRCYTDTARNLYKKFGKDNVSDRVKQLIDNEQGETSIECVHAVEPNEDYIPDSPWAKNKKFISVYYEVGGESDKFLSRSGFDMFPYLIMRSTVNGEDVYPSTCPGIDALADAKSLMTKVREHAKSLKLKNLPVTTGPASMKNKVKSLNAGDFIPNDNPTNGKMEAVYLVNPATQELDASIKETEFIIQQHFFNDIFAVIINSIPTTKTAYEVSEIKEEKLLILSPLLEQIQAGSKYLIDLTFDYALKAGIVPPPPKELQGRELKVEFVSTLAQAQQIIGIGSIERFTTFVANLAGTVDPSAAMKLNINQIIDDYGADAGIDPNQIIPNETVEQEKQAAKQQQAINQAMELAKGGSEVARNMGGVDSTGADLMSRLGV